MLNAIPRPRAKLHGLVLLAPLARCLPAVGAMAALLVGSALPASVAAQEHHHYKLIDVGTFGGPQSFVHENAEVVTNHGTLVGDADTSTSDPNFPNSCLLCAQDPFIFHAFQWRDGVLTDLRALPGANSSSAFWTSNSGLAVGFSEDGSVDPLLGIPAVHAVLWRDGHIEDLGTLEGGYESVALRPQLSRRDGDEQVRARPGSLQE